jgi:hypothetical protein
MQSFEQKIIQAREQDIIRALVDIEGAIYGSKITRKFAQRVARRLLVLIEAVDHAAIEPISGVVEGSKHNE